MEKPIETAEAASEDRKVGAVLVIGAGIGGIQAALDLANSGFKVYLMDRNPSIGAEVARLDKTFLSNESAMRILAPRLLEISGNADIEILTNAELENLEGEAGHFRVSIRMRPRYVDAGKCTGCGDCTEKCPTKIPDEYNLGMTTRKCIHIPFPQAVPHVPVIDPDHCLYLTRERCGICQKTCKVGAIDFDQQEDVLDIDVGSIILAPGFSPFDASTMGEYGYKRFPNVITSLEFERLLSPSGPTDGAVVRPSDGAVPKKVAFIQCVGSRQERGGNTYCSAVCCMYATKHALLGKRLNPEADHAVFFVDVRTFGKEAERYYNLARASGVRYIRHRVSDLEETPEESLRIAYEEEGKPLQNEEFDLVVLSVGMQPPKGVDQLSEKLGIELNEHSFCATSLLSPNRTSRDGIYVCGAFVEPKDIADTVSSASGAAALAAHPILSERGSLVKPREQAGDIGGDGETRIGVFLCHCGTAISGVVDIPNLLEYGEDLPNVVYRQDCTYACSEGEQAGIASAIADHDLTRVVVGACELRSPVFEDTLVEAGLNRYLLKVANIKDQCALVHQRGDEAQRKAEALLRMAVAKAELLSPLRRAPQEVTPAALVIGGGISGMTAALELAEQGYPVSLVERERELGGNLRQVYYLSSGDDPQAFLSDMIDRVMKSDQIRVYRDAEILDVSGHIGRFQARIAHRGREERLESGVIIVATGGRKYEPKREYLYGMDERVISQLDLEEMIFYDQVNAKDIAMIQCVGSRDEDREYCSRICCMEAIKNALLLKARNPQANIYILYRDIRTYGFREEYYREALRLGVHFIRYEPENKPELTRENGQLRLSFHDLILDRTLVMHPDLVVLNVAVVPNENRELADTLGVPLTRDGFFQEAHVKLQPMDFVNKGIFLCGIAHSPKFIKDCIAQAEGAAGRALTVLSKTYIEAEEAIARVEEEWCRGCGACKDVCQFNAIDIVEGERGIPVARIIPIVCQGCGACSVVCPSSAITPLHYTDGQITAMVEAAIGA